MLRTSANVIASPNVMEKNAATMAVEAIAAYVPTQKRAGLANASRWSVLVLEISLIVSVPCKNVGMQDRWAKRHAYAPTYGLATQSVMRR
jgi:hypothetical protein